MKSLTNGQAAFDAEPYGLGAVDGHACGLSVATRRERGIRFRQSLQSMSELIDYLNHTSRVVRATQDAGEVVSCSDVEINCARSTPNGLPLAGVHAKAILP